MSDLNQCTFTGRLGADVEVRRNQEGKPIVNLRLACSDQWKDRESGERKERTEWIQVTIFSEGLCKVAEAYLKKGSRLMVQGQWRTRKWQDTSGNDRYSTECVLQGYDAKMIMLDGPTGDREAKPDHDERGHSGGDYSGARNGTPRQAPRREPAQAPQFSRDLDDDIPFMAEWRV